MSKSDEELMREFQQGQEVAFVALYERYKMAIYGFVYRKLGHQGRAEDLTQEIFLALIEHRQEWRQESSFKTYLYRIAFNRSISELRRREYQITLSADDEAQAQRAANVPSRELSPAAQLEQQQMQYYLRQALTQLDSEYFTRV
jgi:RNA polymerase sigma-70 factor, ECF subfamily